jgi:aminoglycoside phosphotransferase (APT) family kinase protein
MDGNSLVALGKGKTAEVFEYGEGRVLKLFNEGFWEPAIDHEYESMACVNRLVGNAPACYGRLKRDGRIGIVYERISGQPLLSALLMHPRKTAALARRMARTHLGLHAIHTSEPTNQVEKYGEQIGYAKDLIGGRYDAIKRKLASLKSEEVLCHGDFHPGNILVDEASGEWKLIDWMNCYSGSRASDVARSFLMIASPYVPDEVPGGLLPAIHRLKRITAKAYIREYSRLSGLGREDILDWIDVIAAARLLDDIPGEREWLRGIVDGELRLHL